MRAAMKLATGVVPVALGVAMALMSGMAKADDKAAPPQPMTNGVSAQTTQPSVGHRSSTINSATFKVSGPEIYNNYYVDHLVNGNLGILFMPGHKISVNTLYPDPDDPDDLLGGRDNPILTCDIYRVDDDGKESLLNTTVPCRSDGLYTITPQDIGYRLKFKLYTEANPDIERGYSPNPSKSVLGFDKYVTSKVTPPYKVSAFAVNLSKNTLQIGNSGDSATFSVTLAGDNGSPIKGMSEFLKVYIPPHRGDSGDSSDVNGRDRFYLSKVTEVSDGVYSAIVTMAPSAVVGNNTEIIWELNGNKLTDKLYHTVSVVQ